METSKLIKTIEIPADQRKRTTLANNLFYETIEIYDNKVVGKGTNQIVWYYKHYSGIDCIEANINSQFAQVVFLTGINSQNRFVGLDLFSMQNSVAMNDTNRILFCSGMFNFSKTNTFAKSVAADIREAFNRYQEGIDKSSTNEVKVDSIADEIKKLKELMDSGVISNEEFEITKKKLLGI